MQRYLIIGATTVFVIGIAIAAYFYFFTGTASLVATTSNTTTFPSAGNTAPSTSDNGSSATTSVSVPTIVTGQATTVAAQLVEIDKGPVSPGAVAFDVMASSTTSTTTVPDIAVNYIERASGNVFSYLFHTAVLTRISDRTLPGIEEAYWTPDGLTAFAQYLSGSDGSTVNTYALPANGSVGFFLPQDLSGLWVGSTTVVSVASGVNGSIISTEHPDGTHSAQAFTTPLSGVRVTPLGTTGKYLEFTKPSASLPGYAFSVNASGNTSRIAGPLPGLVALASPKGDWVLVSYSNAGVMKTELVNVSTRDVLPLPIGTIADKCVWTYDESAIYCGVPVAPSTDYAYPDDWYQGAVSFSDEIWKIDVDGRFAELVLDFPTVTKQALDATDLSVDPENQVLVFRNKIDGSLWAYQL